MDIFTLTGEVAGPRKRTAAGPALLRALQDNQSILRELGLLYGCADTGASGDTERASARVPEDVTALCIDMAPLAQEQLRVLLLNTKQEVVDVVTVYQGTVNSASVRVAEVLRPAIMANVPGFIIVHNHPSGDPSPSPDDIRVTRRIARAAELMDIDCLDHVVIAASGMVSMKRRGLGFDSAGALK